tara:strand:- start:174 stop:317 length:144 start_codon:yes stop_codon:yes gene_type:complete
LDEKNYIPKSKPPVVGGLKFKTTRGFLTDDQLTSQEKKRLFKKGEFS